MNEERKAQLKLALVDNGASTKRVDQKLAWHLQFGHDVNIIAVGFCLLPEDDFIISNLDMSPEDETAFFNIADGIEYYIAQDSLDRYKALLVGEGACVRCGCSLVSDNEMQHDYKTLFKCSVCGCLNKV